MSRALPESVRAILLGRLCLLLAAIASTACGGGDATLGSPPPAPPPPHGERDAGADRAVSPPPVLTLHTRCQSAVVVGLEWSSLASAARYRVERGGKTLATSSATSFSDLTVEPSASYTYAVDALSAEGGVLATAMTSVATPEATPGGDAPYCPSALLRSATWNWSSGYNQQNGSDLWPSTWGADGSTYLFFGDGGGFFGSNTVGRASFGIARLTGTTPIVDSTDATNVFGGFSSSHPSTINGKAGSILAVGNDFYALGGIYRSGDSGGPAGSPNHYEIVSSKGNAYSWQDTPWNFCSADATGLVTQGTFCATSFVHFGPGNAGAFDDYVYLTAAPVAGWFAGSAPPGPASTYMMRAPNDALTIQSAYTYFAGVDDSGKPIWSASSSDAEPIFSDRNARPMGLGNIVYNSALRRFIGPAQGAFVSEAALYESENPWGPWSTVDYENTHPDGTGGFGDLGSTAYAPGHGDTLGINFINAWTSSDGLTMWAVFSSDGDAPASALLPGLAGQDMDSFSLVSVTFAL